jgi:ATP-dependent Clp protease adaptor protein ClpS
VTDLGKGVLPPLYPHRRQDDVTTKPLEKLEQQRQLFDPYKVLLHNDDTHGMHEVVDALLKSVPQLSQEEAIAIMEEAHTQGVALVISCPLEHAEMYRDRLQSFGLTATIEKG